MIGQKGHTAGKRSFSSCRGFRGEVHGGRLVPRFCFSFHVSELIICVLCSSGATLVEDSAKKRMNRAGQEVRAGCLYTLPRGLAPPPCSPCTPPCHPLTDLHPLLWLSFAHSIIASFPVLLCFAVHLNLELLGCRRPCDPVKYSGSRVRLCGLRSQLCPFTQHVLLSKGLKTFLCLSACNLESRHYNLIWALVWVSH